MTKPRRLLDPESGATPELRRMLEAARRPRTMTRAELARSLSKIEQIQDRASLPMRFSFSLRAGGLAIVLIVLIVSALTAAAAPYVLKLLVTAPSIEEKPSPGHVAAQPGGGRPMPPEEPTPPSDPTIEPAAPEAAPEAADRAAGPPSSSSMPSSSPRSAQKTSQPAPAPEPSTSSAPLGEADSAAASAAQAEQKRFEDEILLLDQARALRSSDPQRALALLEQHAREFPRGKQGFERELLTIEALNNAGRKVEARARAGALLERLKDKPGEAKLKRIVEELQ